MLCSEYGEFLIHGFQADGIEPYFQAEMPHAMLKLEHFEFAVGQ